MKKFNKFDLICLIVVVSMIIIDQVTKILTVQFIPYDGITYIPILGNFLGLTHVHNYGSAWGMMSGQRILLSIISLAASAAIVFYYIKGEFKKFTKFALALVLAGALGNFIDRAFVGYVVDMINLDFLMIFGSSGFPIFNVADCCVVIGCILLAISWVFFEKEAKKDGSK